MDYIGKNIKYIKTANKLSDDDFAKILFKTTSTIESFEKNKRKLTRDDQLLICDTFNIPLNLFLHHDLKKLGYNMCYFKLFNCKTDTEIINAFKDSNNITKVFPFVVDKRIKDSTYNNCLETILNICSFKYRNPIKLNITDIIDCFVEYYYKTRNINSCINAICSIYFFWVLLDYHDLNSLENYLTDRSKDLRTEQANGISVEKVNYSNDFYNKSLYLLRDLKKTNKYDDLVAYLIALKTMLNFTDKKITQIDNAEARSVGTTMLTELLIIDNNYAKKII